MDIRSVFPARDSDYPHSLNTQIQKFLETGQNPNYRFIFNLSFLHEVIQIPDSIGLIRELIKAGAVSVTPLHFAVIYRKLDVIDALIQAGASVNAQDIFGRTSLHMAVTKCIMPDPPTCIELQPNVWIVHKLLKNEDINCNLVDFNGNTPLMLAIKDGQMETVDLLLLSNKADPNISNKDLEAPLHVALSLPPSSIEIQLLLRGASIYSVNKKGQTPLDILFEKSMDVGNKRRLWLILKIIALRYFITSDLKRKIEELPQLSKIFEKYCYEVDHMKRDYISCKVTMHDFIYDCFNGNDFEFLLLPIHKPVVERLVRDIYSEYFIEILYLIPKQSLISILEITACSKKRAKTKGKEKNLVDLFSMLDVIYLFLKYLTRVEVFCLIVAFSDVIIPESMQNLHKRHIFYNSDLS